MSVPSWVKHGLCLQALSMRGVCVRIFYIDLIRLCGNWVLDLIRLRVSVVLDSAVREQ